MLKGQAKKDYQREYMRRKRAKDKLRKGLTENSLGLTTYGCGCKKTDERLCRKHGRV